MVSSNTRDFSLNRDAEHVSLCDTLDRVLNKGVVATGEIVISVAEVDLVYLGVQLVLTSIETANRMQAAQPARCRETGHNDL
jgi:hypothetical protein